MAGLKLCFSLPWSYRSSSKEGHAHTNENHLFEPLVVLANGQPVIGCVSVSYKLILYFQGASDGARRSNFRKELVTCVTPDVTTPYENFLRTVKNAGKKQYHGKNTKEEEYIYEVLSLEIRPQSSQTKYNFGGRIFKGLYHRSSLG